MEVTTEENSNSKEEKSNLILKTIESNFYKLTKNIPEELKGEIQNSLDKFNTLTKGPEKSQCLQRLDILNTIINETSDLIKKNKDVNKKTKKYMTEIKKSVYKLNSLENKPSNIKKEYYNGKYIGDFINNKRQGKGKYIYNNGDIYEGEYKEDLKDGYGTYKFVNGDIYKGDYKKGNFDGKGIYNIREIIRKEILMEKVYINMQVGMFMKENSKTI